VRSAAASRESVAEGSVRGVLHRPAAATGDALVLTHGAGSDREAPLLVAVAEALAARGWLVLRCDLPFRQARPSGPPSPATAERDRAGLREAAGWARRVAPGRVGLGGHSYGGRQATMLAADAPDVADALLLLAYPLHPPGRPEAPRTAHLPRLRAPALFVHGTRDPFGSVEALRAALALIPVPTRLLTIDGAGHDLGRRRAAVADAAAAAFLELVGG
jgi:predicted alpha/beta-hydrolase family hydrolase